MTTPLPRCVFSYVAERPAAPAMRAALVAVVVAWTADLEPAAHLLRTGQDPLLGGDPAYSKR